ncbi:MAG: succinylglutamate desuccinylase/aspartoacylase family protein, partial [Bacteroidia bacterium]|nr:succinylglutamate desuccinylase/aspartoacylase family protein [Bacteroidia bacterium]
MQIFTSESEITSISKLNLNDVPKGSVKKFWLNIVSDGFGSPISIPVIVAKGINDGPVLGLTAAVHGNELNGIPVIQRLFNEIDVNELNGTIIGVPVVNVPSFMRKRRRFNDGVDLNHIMPGKEDGNVSQIYAYRFVDRLVKNFEYLIDLHTASFGRINSYYIRADMDQEATKELAMLQNADIIVHNPPSDGTLRGAADELGIPAITLEVGNPSIFQKRLIRSGIEGIHNVLCHLKMIEDEIELTEKKTVLCKKSYWLYTNRGGLLSVNVDLLDRISKDQKVATIRNIFGEQTAEFFSPESGIVIGKSVSPVNQSGGRILHLG